jgi:hypothetical protein
MKYWRFSTQSPRCSHIVHVWVRTHGEKRTLLDIQSSCPTIQCVIRPKFMLSSIQKRWTTTLDPRIFQYGKATVPLCCRQLVHTAWPSLQEH